MVWAGIRAGLLVAGLVVRSYRRDRRRFWSDIGCFALILLAVAAFLAMISVGLTGLAY